MLVCEVACCIRALVGSRAGKPVWFDPGDLIPVGVVAVAVIIAR